MVSDNSFLSLIGSTGETTDLDENVVTNVIEKEDGAVDIIFDDLAIETELNEDPTLNHYDNLVNYLPDMYLTELGQEVLEGYEEDESSRRGHITQLIQGIQQLGLDDSRAETPFEGACTVYHPLLIESGVKFQAKASNELLPADGPVKTKIIGAATEEKEAAAARVRKHLNWQVTEQMPEYYPNSEKCYFQTAVLGDCFKKKYFDPLLNRTVDYIVSIDKFVVNAMCTSLESADRITEVMHISERTFLSRAYAGVYQKPENFPEPYKIERTDIEMEVDSLLGLDGETGEGYTLLEQIVYIDLEGFEDLDPVTGEPTGVPLSYVITVEKTSGAVLSIRKNWDENGSKYIKKEYHTHYGFVPAFGFYHLGFVHLLGNFQRTLTAIMRSLIDAGQFANLQAGFKSRNLRILDDDEPHRPGEFKSVENFGANITDSIMMLNFKEPSGTLFQLLQFVEARGQKFADSTENVIADSTNYGPVGTTLALLDASTKFFSAIHKRFHAAQKKELQIIARLNFETLPEDEGGYEFNVPGEDVRILKADYDKRIDTVPVSDPNVSSAAHRITMAQTKLQAAQLAPEIHDMREIFKDFYNAMGDGDAAKKLPEPDSAAPLSPVEDIMAVVQKKPIAAFPDQNHDAHIAVKTAFLNDPTQAGNPVMGYVVPAIEANIREHMVMKFASQVKGAQTLGINEEEAAVKVAEFNKFQQENPLGAEDPKVMLAKAELMDKEIQLQKLSLDKEKANFQRVLDLAGIQLDIRAQDIDLEKHETKLSSDTNIKKLQELMSLIKTAGTTKTSP